MHVVKNEDTLDEVARDLTAGALNCPVDGLRYCELPVEQRIIVMQLAQQRNIFDVLDGIDTSLSHVGRWFELSRLYEP